MSSNAFNFKERLGKFQPKSVELTTDERVVDEVAERHDFKSREAVMRVERERRSSEPIDMMNVKGPLSVINRFKQYCNETNQSYWRALDTLMSDKGR